MSEDTMNAGTYGSEDHGSASVRALAMRASLNARGEAEALLAEASRARRAAASDAEIMVAEAEALAEQLVTEAKDVAARATTEARERSEGILSRARSEAAEITSIAKTELETLQRAIADERLRLRAEVRAELEATRDRSLALADDVESRVGSLRPTFQRALDSIDELVAVAVQLRAEANSIELSDEPATAASAATHPVPAPPQSWAAQQAETVHAAEVVEDEPIEVPADAVAVLAELEADEVEDLNDLDEVDDLEDAGVVAREHGRRASDRLPAVAQAESSVVDHVDEHGESGARPLGWLFRAAQS